MFASFSSTWSENRLSKKKYFLHDMSPLLIFGQLSFGYLFSLLCSPVNYPLQDLSYPSQKLWSPMLLRATKWACGLTADSASTGVSKTWLFTCPLKANSEGCQSRHSQFLLQFKWMFVKFCPVFAQLYLMKHAWLPTTRDFLQYACWTHSYRNNSELN